ncbi:hypothetical protein AVEN_86706-1 [Araneus ventricosus]|uniref:Reverse transcriptase domain-containing protein n=1 Tax=Araneus ventricosus TaxID=182803 RepID=A0A4Y2IZW7_ARAVE|nr:hypothetical protein AVEN_86706-1 [Araneus ventricosus]
MPKWQAELSNRQSRRASEKKSTNAQDKNEFSNYKADILMLYIEAVSSLVREKNFESEETSSMIGLFIELKNEFAAFRKDIYSKVDCLSKLICPTDDTIQNEDPRPSLQREIIEIELKSETSTYASVVKLLQLYPKNVRGLRTETVEFFSSVASVEYDVICVTESWLCEDIDSWHQFDERYLVYRKDCGSSPNSSRGGGGVLVAIKKCLSSRKLDVPGLDLEAIWISVKLNHGKKMLLCVVYFPPSSHVDTLFYNNVRYENDCDIANAFADYFSSVFKPSTDFDGNDECNSNCVSDLVKIESVTYDDVVLAIRELKSSLTVGVGNIPSFIIKGCTEFLIYPLLALFNLSLRTKVFPDVWKQTRIIPVFKKGDAQNCENYRPIAILSPFSKMFESIIHKKLYNQVKKSNFYISTRVHTKALNNH